MKLLLDLGNTRLKWQLYQDEMTQASGAWKHDDVLEQAQVWAGVDLQGVWLASVEQSDVTSQLIAQLEGYGHSVYQVTSRSRQAGVENSYADPQKLGVDRWLGLLAAQSGNTAGVVVVDAGTALTVDVLSDTGKHLGGLILPGLKLMRSSLHVNTGLLPEVQGGSWSLGCSTEQAIAGGTLGALVSTVESVCRQAKQDYPNLSCVITGGDAELVYNALDKSTQDCSVIDMEWLFKGLLVASQADSD